MKLRVGFLSMALLAAPVALAQTAVPSAPMTAVLQPYLDSHQFAGAVTLVATKDKVVDMEAMGFRDLATKSPMKTNDVFWIASMSKAHTAACLMMLVDEGKVKLDDPVEKYLPEFKNLMVASGSPRARIADRADEDDAAHARVEQKGALTPASPPITIREILSHTAGLGTKSKRENADSVESLTLKDRVSSYASEPLIAQPGTKAIYTNEGPNIAGRIVEVVSGIPYEVFLQKRLLTPLGMTDTTFWPSAEQMSRLAMSYRTGASGLVLGPMTFAAHATSDTGHRSPGPAGGLFSTAVDVMHFCQMLLNGGTFNGKRLLSEEAVHTMTTNQRTPQEGRPYGLALVIDPTGFGHAGADKTEMHVNKKLGIITVFLIQREDQWPPHMSEEVSAKVEATAEKIVAAK